MKINEIENAYESINDNDDINEVYVHLYSWLEQQGVSPKQAAPMINRIERLAFAAGYEAAMVRK